MVRILIAALLVCLPEAVAAADATAHLRPGAYKVQTKLELPHVEDTGTQKSSTVCITNSGTLGIAVLSDNNPLARCPASNIKQTDDILTFDLICEGHNQAVASARFQLSQDRFTGAFDMKIGGKNMTMTERQEGRRVGVCDRR